MIYMYHNPEENVFYFEKYWSRNQIYEMELAYLCVYYT